MREQLFGLVPAFDGDPDKHMCLFGISDAVGEFGDVARTKRFAKTLEAAACFRHGHGQQRFVVFAHQRAFGDKPQAVEIHVGATADGDKGFVFGIGFFEVTLDARQRQAAGRLHDRAGILVNVLDRGAHLIGGDQHHVIDQLLRQTKRFLADFLHRHAVGKQIDVCERDAFADLEGSRHGVGIHRLDTDDFGGRRQRLDVGGDAGDEPAAAHRHKHRVDRVLVLAQNFHADGALARDHQWVVIGVNVGQLLVFCQFLGVDASLVVTIAVQHHGGTAPLDGVDLDVGGGGGHDDGGLAAEFFGGQRHALCMVSGGSTNHPAF